MSSSAPCHQMHLFRKESFVVGQSCELALHLQRVRNVPTIEYDNLESELTGGVTSGQITTIRNDIGVNWESVWRHLKIFQKNGS
jgi:hypothetical protein